LPLAALASFLAFLPSPMTDSFCVLRHQRCQYGRRSQLSCWRRRAPTAPVSAPDELKPVQISRRQLFSQLSAAGCPLQMGDPAIGVVRGAARRWRARTSCRFRGRRYGRRAAMSQARASNHTPLALSCAATAARSWPSARPVRAASSGARRSLVICRVRTVCRALAVSGP